MPPPPSLQEAVEARLPRYLAELETLVNIDCGSYTAAGVNQVADRVAGSLTELGARVERIPHAARPGELQLGDLVIGHLPGDGPRRLLIGHMDTVFDEGTCAARPYRVRDNRALGPGTSDMKGGLLAGLHALAALQQTGERPAVTFVANPDEEIGSIFSGAHIRRLAPEHDVSLVLECARASGAIVSARKGIADLELTFTGRAAHAGVEPEKGRSAILAAARQVVALHELNGRWPGVTLNAGVIAGGTRPNVVAAECRIQLDLRAATADAFDTARAEVERHAAEQSGRGRAAARSASWQPTGRWSGPRPPAGWPSWPSPSPASSASSWPRRRPAAPATPTRPPAWGCRPWTASAQSAGTTTRRMSGSTWPAWCRAPRCWRP